MARDVVIIGAARTPFDTFGGPLRSMTTVQLAKVASIEAMKRAKVDPSEVEEYYLGINMPTQNRSIARQAALESEIPVDTCNQLTVDRACCSSFAAIAMAYRAIALGEAVVAMGGGAENMSNIPYFVSDLRWGKRLGNITLQDIMIVACPYTGEPRAVQAGKGAVKYGVTREEQDQWAFRSQQLYAKAAAEGKFAEEIIPITLPGKKGDTVIDKDQSPRPDTTLEDLAKLKTVYNSPTVTAGNAPGLSTGAAMVVLMDKEEAEKRGIKPMATIISHAQGSGHPDGITDMPGFTALKALKKANMTIDQIDLIEINEAFAVMPLVSTLVMANGDKAKAEALRAKTNVNGGAIAIGHPTGASAARLVMTACMEMRRRGGGYALVTICGGIGEAECMILKVEA